MEINYNTDSWLDANRSRSEQGVAHSCCVFRVNAELIQSSTFQSVHHCHSARRWQQLQVTKQFKNHRLFNIHPVLLSRISLIIISR